MWCLKCKQTTFNLYLKSTSFVVQFFKQFTNAKGNKKAFPEFKTIYISNLPALLGFEVGYEVGDDVNLAAFQAVLHALVATVTRAPLHHEEVVRRDRRRTTVQVSV